MSTQTDILEFDVDWHVCRNSDKVITVFVFTIEDDVCQKFIDTIDCFGFNVVNLNDDTSVDRAL